MGREGKYGNGGENAAPTRSAGGAGRWVAKCRPRRGYSIEVIITINISFFFLFLIIVLKIVICVICLLSNLTLLS